MQKMTHQHYIFYKSISKTAAKLGLALCVAFCVSCGSKSDPASNLTATTTPLPACPAQPPSYSQAVSAIIKTGCSPCHFAGGTEVSKHDFSTYANVQAQSGSMLNAVYDGLMPPPGSPALSASDANTLLTWLVCRAPNN
jgi:hypothetical protein